ncbi:MAG TPA: SDR family NAD(P)-dependent oxidoreductase [Candidatus Paceibacterota bacterium]|jgi:NAD(P)-dependent dehydrogenase (short-subunit alcohol dehydrogenase family)|nr:SDR family NAD(P)-dependent oxidoreductase [Candidatus Paceibacterota bacterium]
MNQKNGQIKTAFITGANGGIGGAFARELSRRGWRLLLPVRDPLKPDAQELATVPRASVVKCDVGDQQQTDRYVQSFKDEGTDIDLFILAAGTWKWDSDFTGATIEEEEKAAIDFLMKANVQTKEVPFTSFENYLTDDLKNMTGISVGSHAAHFGPGHEFRVDQIGYITAMDAAAKLTKKKQREGIYKHLLLSEPGRIDTPMAREQFARKGIEVDWSKELKPWEFAIQELRKVGLF